MADLSDFKRGQIVGACMVGTSVIKTVQMFGISRGIVSKVMIAFKKEKKTSQHSTSLAESRSCQRETVELYIELLERTVELRHIKLFLSLKNTSEKFVHKNCPSRVAQKYSKKKLQFQNLSFHRKCFKAFGVVYGT